MALNLFVAEGRLTKDPEVRYTQNQTPVASFSIAVDRDVKDKSSGERGTDFIECVAWRSSAEFVQKYFKKGSKAIVKGRLQSRQWEDKNGSKRTTTEVVLDNIYFGESKAKDSTPASAAAPAETSTEDDDDFDPFG